MAETMGWTGLDHDKPGLWAIGASQLVGWGGGACCPGMNYRGRRCRSEIWQASDRDREPASWVRRQSAALGVSCLEGRRWWVRRLWAPEAERGRYYFAVSENLDGPAESCRLVPQQMVGLQPTNLPGCQQP